MSEDSETNENIFEAYYRINQKLVFIISCFDPDYTMKYVTNLNNKLKKYFKIFKSNDPKEFNEIYQKIEDKIIIFVTKLPVVEEYTFNFIKDVFHIHMAVPCWDDDKKNEYEKYVNDMKNLPIAKFINVKENKKIYDNNVEIKLFEIMTGLVEKRLYPEEDSKEFKRMPKTGGKLYLYGSRDLSE